MKVKRLATKVIEGLIVKLVWVGLISIVSIIGYLYYKLRPLLESQCSLCWVLFLITTAIILILIVVLLNQYVKARTVVGLARIDKTIRRGITPDKALARCKNNIKFLGIAANKLVNSPEFEEAIKRCHRAVPEEPIKFLLSHPDNRILEIAARRNRKAPSEYKNMVIETLEKLKQLKEDHGLNIAVRLYKAKNEFGPPTFRLFFIDDSQVLVSYYVFGEGEGLQMPQIELCKAKGKRDTENFYYAFDHYFGSLWEESELYNLQD